MTLGSFFGTDTETALRGFGFQGGGGVGNEMCLPVT